jgi:hypothetical protein
MTVLLLLLLLLLLSFRSGCIFGGGSSPSGASRAVATYVQYKTQRLRESPVDGGSTVGRKIIDRFSIENDDENNGPHGVDCVLRGILLERRACRGGGSALTVRDSKDASIACHPT